MSQQGAIDLEFSPKELKDIERCLNCKLPESFCQGNSNCPSTTELQKRKTRADEINEMAQNGKSANDILKHLGLKPKSVRSLLSKYYDQISPLLRKQIIFELGKEKTNGKQNQGVE